MQEWTLQEKGRNLNFMFMIRGSAGLDRWSSGSVTSNINHFATQVIFSLLRNSCRQSRLASEEKRMPPSEWAVVGSVVI